MRTHSLIKKAMAYLGMPLLFATLGYALLYVAASPVIVPLRNLVSLISLDSTTDPDAAMDSTDLFAGSQAEAASPSPPLAIGSEIFRSKEHRWMRRCTLVIPTRF